MSRLLVALPFYWFKQVIAADEPARMCRALRHTLAEHNCRTTEKSESTAFLDEDTLSSSELGLVALRTQFSLDEAPCWTATLVAPGEFAPIELPGNVLGLGADQVGVVSSMSFRQALEECRFLIPRFLQEPAPEVLRGIFGIPQTDASYALLLKAFDGDHAKVRRHFEDVRTNVNDLGLPALLERYAEAVAICEREQALLFRID